MTIQLATAAFFLFSSFYGSVPTDIGQEKRVDILAQPTFLEVVNQPLTLEEYVREYYKDTPVLAEIAKCESRFRHLGKNGRVLRGELSVEDLGVMQINEFYHEERAKKLGLDLHTLTGNLTYAKWLYQREGTFPWFASSKCWQRADILARAHARTVTN